MCPARDSALDKESLAAYRPPPYGKLYDPTFAQPAPRRPGSAALASKEKPMNHRVWVLGAILFGLAGCAHTQTRGQAADDSEHEKDVEVKTIGAVTEVANVEPIPVSGVGLVVGLDGTGGGTPPGSWRDLLEKQLRVHNVDNPREVLMSPNNALVLVSALIPAGVRKGDPLDVEIVLPPQSKVTSLRGGFLKECVLYNYANARSLAPSVVSADELVLGHPVGSAQGPLLVGFGDGDEAARLREARIWGGGRSKIDRPFYLALNSGQQFARVAQLVAERINETFHGSYRGTLTDIAVAKNNQAIALGVPPQYKLNVPRYLRVVRLIPLREEPDTRSAYRRQLDERLRDPARTITAALRLEALGTESVPVLKRALQHEHPLVRFAAAEALAYLGNPACGDELARLAERQPRLRAFCLTALASIDEAVSHVKLNQLLASPSAETRYGAFRALRALDEHDAAVHGELLNDCFWLHRVAPESAPLVHVAGSRRAEIVLFGQDAYLIPPFSFLAGPEFTITAGRDDEHCTVSRFSVHHGTRRRQCSLKLEDVLKTLADLGGVYPDAVELLRQADQCHCLTCCVAVDAMPQATAVEELAKCDPQDTKFQEVEESLRLAEADLGATPTLYERTTDRRLNIANSH
jgi:hypothetical protein